ncbi:hypothetical protein [Streptomyces mayteni]
MTGERWLGHWHGYGPWLGSGREYGDERLRRPGPSADDEQTRQFLDATVPPMMTGHWLLRRRQTAAHRTWPTASGAVEWLSGRYGVNPPAVREDGHPTCFGLAVKAAHAIDALTRGNDVAWVYWTTTGSLTASSVVSCPNRHHPRIACPLPLRTMEE